MNPDGLAWLPTPATHLLIGAGAVLVYVITTRAGGERRTPAAAVAWVLGIALLPYLMLPLYLFFGRRKFRRVLQPPLPPPEPRHWASDLIAACGLPPPLPTDVRFHADGTDALEGLHRTIDSARTELAVSTFVIGDDEVGRGLVARLVARRRAGVRVCVLIDGAGLQIGGHGPLRALRRGGVEVRVFRPLFSLRRRGPRNLRNHRKMVVADRARLWTGGRNLAAEYFIGRDGHPPWRDLSFEIGGELAAMASQQIEMDWNPTGPDFVDWTPPDSRRAAGDGRGLVQFVPSGPDQREDTVHALLVTACHRARASILVVTPYFVPDDLLRQALRLAVRRGVQLRLLIPRRSNHRLADFVRERPLRELAAAGAQVRLSPWMIHAKAVIVDDELAIAGSVNLDVRSLLLNYELALLFRDPGHIDWLLGFAESLAADAEDYRPRPPGLVRDLAEGLALVVAFQV